jgi:hypothetical protein
MMARRREYGRLHQDYERVIRVWRDPEATVCALVGLAHVTLAVGEMLEAMPPPGPPPQIARQGLAKQWLDAYHEQMLGEHDFVRIARVRHSSRGRSASPFSDQRLCS